MKKIPMMLLWLGAAISISEIFTGGMLAPLGLARGLIAILAGHLIGAGFLAYAGYISFVRRANAMASVAESFGTGGGRIIACCNVVQLLGWTIVMVVQAGSALTGMIPAVPFSLSALILALLVLIWALMFGSPVGQGIHNGIVVLLALLCVVLFAEASGLRGQAGTGAGTLENGMSLMLALELSIAMPVSWLPLVGDYSCRADDSVAAALMPFAGYFAGSVLMYTLGLFIALQGGGDIFTFIAGSCFRLASCVVVLLSTLTTAFLDLYSAVVSLGELTGGGKGGTGSAGTKPRWNRGRLPLVGAGLFILILSALFPVEQYGDFLTAFLTLIGMVFVPVYALFFIDFLFRRREKGGISPFPLLGIAAVGMAGYQIFTRHELGIPSLLSMALVWGLYLILRYAGKGFLNVRSNKRKY
jgi:putative hydroxymethylpyrimidine transporter CytX